MTDAFTAYGKVAYEPPLLERKLEEGLFSEQLVRLPPATGLDLRGFPPRVAVSRHIFARYAPFDAVLYSKGLVLHGAGNGPAAPRTGVLEALERALSDLQYLEEELIRFVLEDGLVTLSHNHGFRKDCVDECFSVRWGGGDLSTCPGVAREVYDMEGSVLGREECLYALDAVLKEGGLRLRY